MQVQTEHSIKMVKKCISTAGYAYVNEDSEANSEAVDIHHVSVRRSAAEGLFVSLALSLLLLAAAFLSFLTQDSSIPLLLWSLSLTAPFFFHLYRQSSVEKESVVIMPAFGIQLETRYFSGRTIHRFIPMDKILKPVLNECLTPTTCYWSLSLIIRDEEELMLVFKELRPPVKMLEPIWKALRAATDT